MRLLRRFARLSGAEQRLLLRAAMLVALVRLALWVVPFRRLWLVTRKSELRPRLNAGASPPERIAWAVAAVSRYIPKATCLTQALAAKMLLQRAGHCASLRIGVAQEDGREFKAHAWVELEGKALVGGTQALNYTVLSTSGVDA